MNKSELEKIIKWKRVGGWFFVGLNNEQSISMAKYMEQLADGDDYGNWTLLCQAIRPILLTGIDVELERLITIQKPMYNDYKDHQSNYHDLDKEIDIVKNSVEKYLKN